ncbi:transcription initiation factor TFIID subunit 14 [Myxozyma melibiosi]|uniref:Transcription initiation factor TFIID subunit 14 n=1 Tax=Myxozyma melibiosi TaxID=54550 RepID=A0ABR1F2W4_9ASCO
MTQEVVRTVKITTTSEILTDLEPAAEGFPMRKWSVRVCLVGPSGEEVPANIFDKVTYRLHPTFNNPNRTLKKPPFKLEEQGWGEFDMTVALHVMDKGGEHTVVHDLNFLEEKYEVLHKLSFPTNRPALAKVLAESGPVPESVVSSGSPAIDESKKRKHESGDSSKKKTKHDKPSIDMDRLAESLEKLGEDDLLQVVQMVTDNRTPEMYIKNDVEEGEFHLDLYTMPENLLKMLWDFVKKRTDI